MHLVSRSQWFTLPLSLLKLIVGLNSVLQPSEEAQAGERDEFVAARVPRRESERDQFAVSDDTASPGARSSDRLSSQTIATVSASIDRRLSDVDCWYKTLCLIKKNGKRASLPCTPMLVGRFVDGVVANFRCLKSCGSAANR
jgi:hypothetical protein